MKILMTKLNLKSNNYNANKKIVKNNQIKIKKERKKVFIAIRIRKKG
jgi:hypothetical protein